MDIVHLSPLRATSFHWRPDSSTWKMTIVCRGTYRLQHGAPSLVDIDKQEAPEENDRYLDSGPLAERILYYPSDLVPEKPKVDVLLVGHARSPTGEPVQSLMTKLIVAGQKSQVEKSIEVFCDRAWSTTGKVVFGEPLVEFDLSYAQASGGPGSLNPAGIRTGMDLVGMVAEDPSVERKIPSVVEPGLTLSDLGEPIATIGFGPVSSVWSERREKLPPDMRKSGLPTRWFLTPFPDDFDYSYFNAAPDGQRPDALLGDDQIVLMNICSAQTLVTYVPREQPVVFVKYPNRRERKVQMRCDTLWIDTDKSIFTLTWRGNMIVESPSLEGQILVSQADPERQPEWDETFALYEKMYKGQEDLPGRRRDPTEKLLINDQPLEPTRDQDRDEPVRIDSGAKPESNLFDSVRNWILNIVNAVVSTARRATAKLRRGAQPSSGAPALISIATDNPALPLAVSRSEQTSQTTEGDALVQEPVEPSSEAAPLSAAPTSTNARTSTFPRQEDAEQQDPTPTPPEPRPPASRHVTQPNATSRVGPTMPFRPSHVPEPPTFAPPISEAPPSVAPPPPSQAVPAHRHFESEPSVQPRTVEPVVQHPPAIPDPGGASSPPPRGTGARESKAPANEAASKSGWKSRGVQRGAGSEVPPPSNTPPRSAVAASNAALSGHQDGGQPAARNGAAIPSPRPKVVIELLWCDPTIMPRIRQQPQWTEILAQIKGRAFEDELSGSSPEKRQEIMDRREMAGLLARGDALDMRELIAAFGNAVTEDGTFAPPLVLVAGELELPFDEIEALRAMMAAMQPLAGGDKRLQETLGTMDQLLKTPWLKGAGGMAEGLTENLKEAYAQAKRKLPPNQLEEQTERTLLEQRAYQRRTVMGKVCIRSLLTVSGEQVPVYLPDALGQELPSFRRFGVRMVGDVRAKMDQYEVQQVAIRGVGIGRVMKLQPPRGQ